MKLVFVAVSLIVAITVDCRHQPEPDSQHSVIAEQPQWPNLALEPEDSVDDDSGEPTVGPPPGLEFTLGFDDSEETTSITDVPPYGPDMNFGRFEEDEDESDSELRGSGCKPDKNCKFYGGYCVTNSSQCQGKLRPGGCKGGTNCMCCIPGCPTHLPGFFFQSGANQCFKLLNDAYRNFTQAQAKCKEEDLVLAHPLDVLYLRSYLVQEYGYVSYPFVNARGDGNYMRWVDNRAAITKYNPFWYSTPRNSSSFCLTLLTYDYYLKVASGRPYYSFYCSNRRFAICELV